jgi:hypothetical protein
VSKEFNIQRVKQSDYLCGPFALKLGFYYQGEDYNVEELEKKLNIDGRGTDLWNIYEFLLKTRRYSATISIHATYRDLIREHESNRSIIVSRMIWSDDKLVPHFSSVNSITTTSIEFTEPASETRSGLRHKKYTKKSFERLWHDDETERGYVAFKRSSIKPRLEKKPKKSKKKK